MGIEIFNSYVNHLGVSFIFLYSMCSAKNNSACDGCVRPSLKLTVTWDAPAVVEMINDSADAGGKTSRMARC